MKKTIKILCLLFISCLLLSSCQRNEKSLYLKSPKADVFGEYVNIIDVYVEEKSIPVSDNTVVTLKIGIGGDRRHHKEKEPIYFEIIAEGCKINGVEDVFEKEYPDYFTDDKYDLVVSERWIDEWTGRPDRTPKYSENFEITFPSTECKGEIEINLIDKFCQGAGYNSTLKIYYASNGSVLWFADEVILYIDEDNKPVL